MQFIQLINLIHLISTAVWIGGMVYTGFIFMPSLELISPSERPKILAAVAKKFTITAWLCIILLIITGILRTPTDMMFNTSASYGIILTVKHILVLLAIAIGLLITFMASPKLRKYAPKEGERPAPEFFAAQKQIKILSSVNMFVGLAILVTVSLF